MCPTLSVFLSMIQVSMKCCGITGPYLHISVLKLTANLQREWWGRWTRWWRSDTFWPRKRPSRFRRISLPRSSQRTTRCRFTCSKTRLDKVFREQTGTEVTEIARIQQRKRLAFKSAFSFFDFWKRWFSGCFLTQGVAFYCFIVSN